jgi:hypothetical protein
VVKEELIMNPIARIKSEDIFMVLFLKFHN